MSNEYRVTFGAQYARQVHPTWNLAHPDGWFTILAVDYDQARTATLALFGTAWSDISPAETVTASDERLYWPRGEIGRADTRAIAGLSWPAPSDPSQAVPFQDGAIRGAVSSRLSVHGVVTNGQVVIGHPPVMSRDQLRELAAVAQDLLGAE